MTLAVAKVGMSTSGFFCPTVLQSVQYESHSKDLVGYRPNLVTRAYPQLVCQLEGDQSQAIAFDVSRRLVFSPSSCLSWFVYKIRYVTWNSPLVSPQSFPVDDLQLKKTDIICVSFCQVSHRISFSSFSFAILYMPVYTSKASAIPSGNFQFSEYLPNFSIKLDTLDLDSWRKVLGTLCCRWFVAATASGTMLGVLGQPEAQAGKRKPPPPEEKKVEEDKGLSAYDQKLLASARRKEALKLSIEEKKAKGKSVASKLWPSNFLSSSSLSHTLGSCNENRSNVPFFLLNHLLTGIEQNSLCSVSFKVAPVYSVQLIFAYMSLKFLLQCWL